MIPKYLNDSIQAFGMASILNVAIVPLFKSESPTFLRMIVAPVIVCASGIITHFISESLFPSPAPVMLMFLVAMVFESVLIAINFPHNMVGISLPNRLMLAGSLGVMSYVIAISINIHLLCPACSSSVGVS